MCSLFYKYMGALLCIAWCETMMSVFEINSFDELLSFNTVILLWALLPILCSPEQLQSQLVQSLRLVQYFCPAQLLIKLIIDTISVATKKKPSFSFCSGYSYRET